MQYQSEKGEWAAIRRLMLSADLTNKQGRNVLFRELERREPIKPYNRMRLAEMLTRKVAADISLRIIERGLDQGQRHPLLDYQRGLCVMGAREESPCSERGEKGRRKMEILSQHSNSRLYLHLDETGEERRKLG